MQNPDVGRPTAYRPDFARQAGKLCELGATIDELAEFFLVSRGTIFNWQDAHPAFRDAIDAGSRAPERLAALVRRLEQARALMLLDGQHACLDALRVAVAFPVTHQGRKAPPEVRTVNARTLHRARTIVAAAPELVEQVLSGAVP